MPITLKDLTKKLKNFTQAATAKFKEPKSTELVSALQKIIIAINNFNSIDVVTEQDIKEFREKIKSIYKSTCLRKYYNPGENDKLTYKRSGLAGIIFRELYIYLTENFRQGVNTAYAPAAGWLSIKDKTKLKEAFKNTYKFKFGSDEAWIESILYNEKVLTKLFDIGQRVQIKQAPQPPKAATSTPSNPPPRKPEQKTQANRSGRPLPKANQNSTAPATKQSNQSSPPSISDNLNRSIEKIFNGLTFTEELSNIQNENLKNLKKYFKDNAETITDKILRIKDYNNKKAWINYFIGMPFSKEKEMVYNKFIDFLYYQKNNLFTEMIKDNIVVDIKKIPKPPKAAASTPPTTPPPPIPQPTRQGNTKPTAEQLKNASGSLKKITIPTRTKRKSAVEQAFESATNSAMFKQAQQQNQTPDEDDDDAWTD